MGLIRRIRLGQVLQRGREAVRFRLDAGFFQLLHMDGDMTPGHPLPVLMLPAKRTLHHAFIVSLVPGIRNIAIVIFQAGDCLIVILLFRDSHRFPTKKCNCHIGIGRSSPLREHSHLVLVLLIQVGPQSIFAIPQQLHRVGQNLLPGVAVIVLAGVIASGASDEHIPLIQAVHTALPEDHHKITLGGVFCSSALTHSVQRVVQVSLIKRRFLCPDLRKNGSQVHIHKFLQAVRLVLRSVRRQRIEGQVLRLIRCIGHHRAQGVQLKLAACPVVCGNLQWVLELEKIGHLRLRGVVLCEILKYLRCFGDPVSAVDQLLAVFQQQPRAVIGVVLRYTVHKLLIGFFQVH